MSRLSFSVARELIEDGRVIARVEGADGEALARLVVGDDEYDIVQRRRRGWSFQLVERTSRRQIGDFVPFWIRRGGKIRLTGASVSLRSRLLRPERWTLSSDRGQRVEAITRPGETAPTIDAESWRQILQPTGCEVIFEAGARTGALPNELLVLAFGGWLMASWAIAPNGGVAPA
jgi:hypothetical protein